MRTCILPKWETSYTKKGSCKKMRNCTLPTMTETPESVTTAKGTSAKPQNLESSSVIAEDIVPMINIDLLMMPARIRGWDADFNNDLWWSAPASIVLSERETSGGHQWKLFWMSSYFSICSLSLIWRQAVEGIEKSVQDDGADGGDSPNKRMQVVEVKLEHHNIEAWR